MSLPAPSKFGQLLKRYTGLVNHVWENRKLLARLLCRVRQACEGLICLFQFIQGFARATLDAHPLPCLLPEELLNFFRELRSNLMKGLLLSGRGR